MDKPESEIEFVERVIARWNDEGEMVGQDMLRIFALARRGAEMQSSDDDKRAAIRDLERQGWKLPPPGGGVSS